jgi:integrase
LYDLRHSFCSLLLAEGRTVHYVAGQLGHGPEQTLNRYGHVLDELADAPQIDAEAEIRKARDAARTFSVRSSGSEEAA